MDSRSREEESKWTMQNLEHQEMEEEREEGLEEEEEEGLEEVEIGQKDVLSAVKRDIWQESAQTPIKVNQEEILVVVMEEVETDLEVASSVVSRDIWQESVQIKVNKEVAIMEEEVMIGKTIETTIEITTEEVLVQSLDLHHQEAETKTDLTLAQKALKTPVIKERSVRAIQEVAVLHVIAATTEKEAFLVPILDHELD